MEPEDVEMPDWRHMEDIPCLTLEGKSGEILSSAFKAKENLVPGLTINELILDYLSDTHLMNLITSYMVEHMGSARLEKSVEEAISLRESGNEAYRKKDLNEALSLYNQSAVKAPELGGSCLALAFANRSAVLYEMQEYKKCLVDIDLALNNGYPADSKFKLYRREAECLLHLSRFAEALESANSAEEWVKKSEGNLAKTKVDQIVLDIENIKKQIKNASNVNNIKPDEEVEVLQLSDGANPKLDPLSAAVTIAYTEDRGRHTIANRPLEVGAVLIIERPFVAALVPDLFQEDHCWYCTVTIKFSTVPCPYCCQVVFCSEECRQESWTKHHYMECGYQHFLIHLGQSFVSWRILLAVGVEQMFKIREELSVVKSPDKVPGFDSQGRYDHKSYYTIYHMRCFDENSNMKMKQDCVNAAVYSLRFLELLYPLRVGSGEIQVDPEVLNLRRTKLNTEHLEETTDAKRPKREEDSERTCFTWEERLFLASILARHFLQVKVNSCYIDEYFRYPNDSCPINLMESQPLGGGVYPASSLFNHSCDPNVSATSVGSLNIFRTIREIKENEELCISYGPNWYEKPRDVRQKHLLENYNFECTCEVCEAEKGIVDVSMAALFQDPESGMSAVAGYDMSLVRMMEKFSKASLNLVLDNLRVSLVLFEECLVQCLAYMRSNGRKYSRMFGETLEQISSALEKMLKVCSDQSDPGKQICSFENIENNKASRPYVVLMLEALKTCLDSVSNIDYRNGMESDIFSAWALRFIRLFLKMIPSYPDVRNNPDWLSMAQDILGIVAKIRINREIHYARSDGYMEYIGDVDNYLRDGLRKKGLLQE